jgi:two-component system chemotaxis response regulator CheB
MGDGTHGLLTIKRAGGVAIVQDPAQAQVPVMPLTAMQNVEVDYVVPDEEIGQLVTQIVMNSHHRDSPRNARPAMLPTPSPENPGPDALETGSLKGSPAPLTCPDCGGTLWEFKEGALVRYRCHVGHGFSEDSLANDQAERLEDILWSALRAIEESIELRKRMADRAEIRNLTAMLPGLRRDIDDAERRADALRALLLEPQGSSSESAVAPAKTRRNDGKKKGR